MALLIPSYPNPFDPANPLQSVYAWMSGIGMDASTNAGRFSITLNPNAEAWQARPLDSIAIGLGQVFRAADPSANPPVAEIRIRRLDELLSDPSIVGSSGMTFAQLYAAIGGVLYAEALKHPSLSAGTLVA